MSAPGDLPLSPEFVAACERGDVFQRAPRPIGPDGFTPLVEEVDPEAVREAFALGAAWALGDDEGTLADLREQVEMLTAQRDNAERKHEVLESAIEALAADFSANVDWSTGRSNYGDNAAWELAASALRALLPSGAE